MPVADQRAAVFARIREAVKVKAPHLHAHVVEEKEEHRVPGAETYREWLPSVGTSRAEQIELFAQNSVGLKTEFYRVPSLEEAGRQLAAIAQEAKWERVATHRHPLAEKLTERLMLPYMITDDGYAVSDLESSHAAITGCDYVIAQTGTLLVSAGTAGGRALSVLPPHHVVIAREDQVVPDLAAALDLAAERYAGKWPSFLSFITGPSRTGDIERILVLGAHGPKRLTVFLLP